MANVLLVELRDIELPADLKRAMARHAEVGWGKRAEIIAAKGEALSADRPADVISDTLQLCPLQVLAEVAAEENSTIVFPARFIESVRALTRFVEEEAAGATKPLPRPDSCGAFRDPASHASAAQV
ncbi:hypothetical protein ABZ471_25865 [Streptomyces sp. NPDC005728]|uniref:hypothetical protein n=1 Tax=Streptomyces sp. NPDC005728 TaxID=3157054 RepID=UPI0033CF0DD5